MDADAREPPRRPRRGPRGRGRDGASRARRRRTTATPRPRCCGTAATGWWPRSSTRLRQAGAAAVRALRPVDRRTSASRRASRCARSSTRSPPSSRGSGPLVVDAGGDTATVVRRLALVTGIVGRGKDELARAFLDQQGEGRGRGREPVRGASTGCSRARSRHRKRLSGRRRGYTAPAAAPDPRSHPGSRAAQPTQKREPRVSARSMLPAKLIRQPRSGQCSSVARWPSSWQDLARRRARRAASGSAGRP